MASHRLIHCSFSEAVAAAAAAHHQATIDHVRAGRRVRLHWPSELAGEAIGWTLELEQGANGVLAHISVGPAVGASSERRSRWWDLVSQPFSARMLGKLAAGATRSAAS